MPRFGSGRPTTLPTVQTPPSAQPSGGGFIQGFKDWYDDWSKPFSFLPEDLTATKEIEQKDWLPQPVKSFARAAIEGPYEAAKYFVGNPIGLASTAGTLGMGRLAPPAVRGAATGLDLLTSTAGVGRGAIDVAEGVEEGDLGKAGLGALSTSFGTVGAIGAGRRLRKTTPTPAPQTPVAPTVQAPTVQAPTPNVTAQPVSANPNVVSASTVTPQRALSDALKPIKHGKPGFQEVKAGRAVKGLFGSTIEKSLENQGEAGVEINRILRRKSKDYRTIMQKHDEAVSVINQLPDGPQKQSLLAGLAKVKQDPSKLPDVDAQRMAELIPKTKNPEYTKDLIKAARGDAWGNSSFNRAMSAVADEANRWMSALYLSQFSLSNTANLSTVPMQTNLKAFRKALIDAAKSPSQARHIAAGDGALYDAAKGVMESARNLKITDLYGIKQSENFNRIIADGAGRHYARDLFEGLKQGKIKPKYAAHLEEITDTPLAELAKQGDLTEKQLSFAGFTIAEQTQGLAEARKLPEFWSHPALQTFVIFKKYAVQQTKAMKDAIKRDPVKNIPILLAASQLFGEAIGGGKAALRGAVRGTLEGDIGAGVDQEMEARTDPTRNLIKTFSPTLAENDMVSRVVDNMIQAWALGIFADLLYASTSATGVTEAVAGPMWGTISEAYHAGTRALSGGTKLAVGDPTEGSLDPAGRFITRRTPVVGPGLQRAWFPTQAQTRQERKYP